MNYTLRDYRITDAAVVRRLLEVGLEPYGLHADYDDIDADLRDVHQHYLQSGGAFRLLVVEKRVVGMYGLYNYGQYICELRKMYLDPDYKGRGLGKVMMEEALDLARELEFKEMRLETNAVLKEAIAMYEQIGFNRYQPEHLAARCDVAMRMKLA